MIRTLCPTTSGVNSANSSVRAVYMVRVTFRSRFGAGLARDVVRVLAAGDAALQRQERTSLRDDRLS